jgi:uncharacterized membrane protein
MSNDNPYAAPQSEVAVVDAAATGTLRDSPRSNPAGRGWGWLADAFSLFKASPLIWIVNIILFGVTMVLLSIIPWVGGLAQMLLSPLFTGGLMFGARQQDRGEPLEVADLFAGFQRRAGGLALLGLMSMVGSVLIMLGAAAISGVGFATLMAFSGGNIDALTPEQIQTMLPVLLLAVAVMLLMMAPLMMMLWFSPALLVLHHEVSVFAAMKMSFVGCLKNVLPFLVYGIVGALFSVLATIPLGLGWLVLLPMIVASIYVGYKDIFIK